MIVHSLCSKNADESYIGEMDEPGRPLQNQEKYENQKNPECKLLMMSGKCKDDMIGRKETVALQVVKVDPLLVSSRLTN